MAPTLLLDLAGLDLTKAIAGPEELERVNPQRGAMRMLDGIHWLAPGLERAVAFKDIRADEFWASGHIPGRPIFPGVLMIEAAAQLASYLFLRRAPHVKFMGFSGVDEVKFRGMVQPGDHFIVLGNEVEFRPRRCICKGQGVVRGTVVFEATITGMPM